MNIHLIYSNTGGRAKRRVIDDKYTATQINLLNKIVAAVDLLSKSEHLELSVLFWARLYTPKLHQD